MVVLLPDDEYLVSAAGDHPFHLHCFTDDWKTCKIWLDAYPACKVGLTSIVTQKRAHKVREVARNIPLDRLLLETDAPYMLPEAVRSPN